MTMTTASQVRGGLGRNLDGQDQCVPLAGALHKGFQRHGPGPALCLKRHHISGNLWDEAPRCIKKVTKEDVEASGNIAACGEAIKFAQ
jgi:hypothetical protein